MQFASVDVDEAKDLKTAVKAAIVIKGVPATQAGTLRGVVNDKFAAVADDSGKRDRLPPHHAAHRVLGHVAAGAGPDQEHASIRRSMRSA